MCRILARKLYGTIFKGGEEGKRRGKIRKRRREEIREKGGEGILRRREREGIIIDK